MHACGRLIGDLNGVLQNALGNDVALRRGCRLSADEDPEVWVTFLAELLQFLLQGTEPLGHQVDVLLGRKDPQLDMCFLYLLAVNSYQVGS